MKNAFSHWGPRCGCLQVAPRRFSVSSTAFLMRNRHRQSLAWCWSRSWALWTRQQAPASTSCACAKCPSCAPTSRSTTSSKFSALAANVGWLLGGHGCCGCPPGFPKLVLNHGCLLKHTGSAAPCPPLQRPADMACLTKVSTDPSAGKASPMRLPMFRRTSPFAAPGEQQVRSVAAAAAWGEGRRWQMGESSVVEGAASRGATQQRLALPFTCFKSHVGHTFRQSTCSRLLPAFCIPLAIMTVAGGGGCGHHHHRGEAAERMQQRPVRCKRLRGFTCRQSLVRAAARFVPIAH